MSLVFGLLGRIPVTAWLVLALAGWGWWGHRSADAAVSRARTEAAERREAEAETQRLAARAAVGAGDETRMLVEDARRRAGAAERRMRALAAAWAASSASAPGGACGDPGAPAAAVLHDQARSDLVQLAEDANVVAGRLVGCQRLLRTLTGNDQADTP